MKLLMLKGLPASGKSTYALELVKEGWTRVNKDELRLMLHGGKWSKTNEKEVVAARNAMVKNALEMGRNVVVDDTNFSPTHEESLRQIMQGFEKGKVEFEVKEFDTDVEECIARDLHRGEKAVGEQVIRRMWRESVEPVQSLPPFSPDKENAVIFDIDGTLAIKGDRSPYAWERVGEDTVNDRVLALYELFQAAGYKMLIFSGRDMVCYEQTTTWLEDNGITYKKLWMRNEDDTRKDHIVKREFYEEAIQRYNIAYVVDDRPQVCRMWHTLGLCLLKVGDPDLEF